MNPKFKHVITPRGSHIIRFDNLSDLFWYDEIRNNPKGLGMTENSYGNRTGDNLRFYKKDRGSLSSRKLNLIAKAKKDLSIDKEFMDLVYKAKTMKREFKMNKFSGNLSVPHFAMQNERMFKKGHNGAKKASLDMAFQVGVLQGRNYTEAFISVIKTVLMCQALGIALNIDVFDSDTKAINGRSSYVICNIAKSEKKLNFVHLLACSHEEFFTGSLFNGYSALNNQAYIGTFLPTKRIKEDLGDRYDVIGGNLLTNNSSDMVHKILKIANF